MASGSGRMSCYKGIKYMFFGFHILFWLMGCALLGVGIWLHIEKDDYVEVSDTEYLSVTAACIAAGCLMIVISFCGCCGAMMENQWMLMAYFVLVLIIFILEVSVGVLALVFRDDISDDLRSELHDSLHKYQTSSGVRDAWDEIQEEFECCGVDGPADWYPVLNVNISNRRTPESCCDLEDNVVQPDNCWLNPDVLYTKGCYDKVKDELKEYLYIIGIVTLIIGLLQILGIVSSMALFCFLRSDKFMEDSEELF